MIIGEWYDRYRFSGSIIDYVRLHQTIEKKFILNNTNSVVEDWKERILMKICSVWSSKKKKKEKKILPKNPLRI